MTAEEIAAGLTAKLRDAMLDDERGPLLDCELNALGLVHLDVVKDAYDGLIYMTARFTEIGQQVHAILESNHDRA